MVSGEASGRDDDTERLEMKVGNCIMCELCFLAIILPDSCAGLISNSKEKKDREAQNSKGDVPAGYICWPTSEDIEEVRQFIFFLKSQTFFFATTTD